MYKNDVGLSWEISNFNSLSEWVLEPYISNAGTMLIVDDHHLVLRTRIQEAILKAVVAERQACADVANSHAELCKNPLFNLPSDQACETIAMSILSRNFTEAKKQDTYHVSEDEKV